MEFELLVLLAQAFEFLLHFKRAQARHIRRLGGLFQQILLLDRKSVV